MPEYDLFISYSRDDSAAVEPLARQLQAAGLRVYFDRWYAVPGQPWMPALEAALQQCRAVAVFVGQEMGGWQQKEKAAALQRQTAAAADDDVFPVIPVLLQPDAAPLGFLDQLTWIDLAAVGPQAAVAALVRAARGEPPGPDLLDASTAAKQAVCPYRGLLTFREEDAPFFHGRQAAIDRLVEAVARHELVAVVGDSGSGKSSVVRAGLLPVLRQRREQPWDTLTMLPGQRPFHSLAAALLSLLEPDLADPQRIEAAQQLADALAQGRTPLRDEVARVLQRQAGTQRLLLVIDQWEELFTQTESDTVRRAFIEQILDATAHAPLTVVLTLRGDFFSRAITSQRDLADRLQGAQVNLGPMTRDELRQAIELPAERAGLSFEPNLVDLILEHATAETGNLPLLEFVLRELWQARDVNKQRMQRQAYDRIGQVKGAIAQWADAVFKRLTQGDVSAKARFKTALLRLVRSVDGEPDTRQRVPLPDFDGPSRALLERLVTERLLVTAGTASPTDGGADGVTVEVAHEALIQHWGLLRDWVQADRAFMLWRTRLDDEVAEWRRQRRSSDRVLGGADLAQARSWLKLRRDDLSEGQVAYIRAGVKRRLVVGFAVGSIASIGLVSVLYFAVTAELQRRQANAARDRAESLVEYMVINLRDQLEPIGRLDLMVGINARVDAYYQQLGDQGDFDIQRRRGVALDNQGNAHLAQGRLDAARKAYEQSLAISERLAKADPSNTGWQRDLSVSFDNLGNVEVSAGRLDAARKAYEQSLAISERLAKADPSNTKWQRDLSVSFEKLGDVEVSAGRLDAARKAYEQSQAIFERLAKADASNTQWQRDLSVSFNKLGDVDVRAGRLEAAGKAYQQSLAIRERLAKADASNTEWPRDLSISFERLGDVDVSAGRLDAARKAYEQLLVIRERLAKADASNTDWQRDLSVSYMRLADVEAKAGRSGEAMRLFGNSLAISSRLVETDASNATWKSDLDDVRQRIAELKANKAAR